MTGWEDVTLASLGRFSSGKPIKPGLDGSYQAFGSNGVIGRSVEARYPRGLIVGRVGAYCGSIVVSRQPFWASDNTIVIEPTRPADLDYLYFLLKNARLNQHAGGSAQPLVTQGSLKSLIFAVPDPASRSRIGTLLRSFDELIETNRRRVQVLEVMARTIYREWFVHFRYPGRANARFMDWAIGPVPEGWSFVPLFEAADVGFGFSFKSARFSDVGPSPVIRIRDVPAGITRTFSDETPAERYRVRDSDVLIGMDGDFYLHQWRGGDAWLNQRVARLRPKNGMSGLHLMLGIAQQIIEWNGAIVGTTVAHLGKRHLEQVRVMVPPEGLLQWVTPLFDDLAQQACSLDQASRKLAAMRDLLLPKLVSGQIDVSSLDLDALVEGSVA